MKFRCHLNWAANGAHDDKLIIIFAMLISHRCKCQCAHLSRAPIYMFIMINDHLCMRTHKLQLMAAWLYNVEESKCAFNYNMLAYAQLCKKKWKNLSDMASDGIHNSDIKENQDKFWILPIKGKCFFFSFITNEYGRHGHDLWDKLNVNHRLCRSLFTGYFFSFFLSVYGCIRWW